MQRNSHLKKVYAFVLLFCLLGICFGAVFALANNRKISYGVSVGVQKEVVQNFVVAGIDEDGTRTDLVLLCQYSFSDDSLEVLQIPRDTKVENGRYDKKINSAYGTPGRIETLFDEVAGLTGIRPQRYVIVGFEGFRELIDAIGGVEFDVPARMYYTDPKQDLKIDLYPGKQLLDGKKAEMFMRFRQNDDGTGYAEGDIGRMKAQKNLYGAIVNKLTSAETIWDVPEIVSVTARNVKTDFSVKEIMKYVRRIPSFKSGNVRFHMLPGEGGYDSDGISYFFCDREQTKLLMKEYFGTE